MEIKQAIEFGDTIREKISELFVDEFYNIALKYISKNKEKLQKVFVPMIAVECFYIVIIDNEIAGMAACLRKGQVCIKADKKIFIKHLGLYKGLVAYFIYKDHNKKLEGYIDEKTAILDLVATASKYKRKGVASTIIKYLYALPKYNHYFLEVADTNINAVKLYTKLGFKEIHREKYIPNSGINYFVHMKYSKD